MKTKEGTLDQNKDQSQKPVVFRTELMDLSVPKNKTFIVDFLKTCWRGMKYDEENKVFVPDPHGR